MKRLSNLLLCVVFLVGALPVMVHAWYEPPHFSVPVVTDDCYQCHITGAFHHNPPDSYPSAINNLCESCHFDGGPATGAVTHSSRTTDNGYGNWEVDCWACHNPHAQEQNIYFSSTYGKYIRRDFNAEEIKEINPADPGPYYWPVSILRTVTSGIVEFKGPTEFVDGDLEAADDICQVCHVNTHYYNTGAEFNTHADLGANSQPGGNCTTCHQHSTGFKAGHGTNSFAWNDTTKASCGTASCHDWSNSQNVIVDIHSNNCLNCHSTESGGTGTAVDRDVGFATNAGAAPHDEACTVCHTLINGHTHHDRPDSYAAGGTCSQCHEDKRIAAGYTREAQARQLSCRVCHVRLTGTTLEVLKISAGEAGIGATGDATGNTFTPLTVANGYTADHTFNNNNATGVADAIDNYGICFECHGTTGRVGYDTATNPVPYHTLPRAGAYLSGSVSYIGGLGWQGNLDPTSDGSTFRGGLTWSPQGNSAYFPIGKGLINLGYAQHNLTKGATNTMAYKDQNTSALDVYATMIPGLVFGLQTVDHLAQTWAVPHFDSICSSGSTTPCDNITGATITQVKDGGSTLGFNVTATSTTGANLHIIYGGVEIGSIASGTTLQFRYRDARSDALDKYYCMDQFNAGNPTPIWIVSEDGGAVNAGNSFLRGTATGDSASVPETCSPRVTTSPAW